MVSLRVQTKSISNLSATFTSIDSFPSPADFTPGNSEIVGAISYGIDPYYSDATVYLKKNSDGSVLPIKINKPYCVIHGDTSDIVYLD